MYFRGFQQRNCNNNNNQRSCQSNQCQVHDRCECNGPRSNHSRCNEPRCNEPRCNEPCCNEPRCNESRCQPCYNEEDYRVDVIHELLEEYNKIERRADAYFNTALANLCDAIEGIEKGLECNKEGRIVWNKMECWLARYYERFGTYCDCMEKMQELRECVKHLLIHEWTSLEATRLAYSQLEDSRVLDKQLYVIKTAFQDQCIPKC